MDLGLEGKIAIVAASSKGLGKASALALAREGARVTICARTGTDLESAAAEIRRDTGSVKQPVDNIDLSNGIRPGIAGLTKAVMPGLASNL